MYTSSMTIIGSFGIVVGIALCTPIFLVKGILSSECGCEYESTTKASFGPFSIHADDNSGCRQKIITDNLFDIVSAEISAKEKEELSSVDYHSTTHCDFSKG